MGAPQDGTIKNPAVFKAVWQSGNIDAPAMAKVMNRHLDFLVPLNQNLRIIAQGVDVLAALPKVHRLCAVLKDKVIRMLLPVILVIIQSETGFLFHAQDGGQLEIMALVLVAGRFSHTDKAAAVPYKAADSC